MGATTSTLTPRTSAGLVWELVLRDIRLRYRRSVLGLLWSQVAPLSYVAVLSVVFTRVVPLGIPDYPVFVLLGMLPWLWFQSALTSSTASVVAGADLVRQPAFPRESLPVVAVAGALVNHLLALPVALGAAVVATGRLPVTAVAVVPLLVVQFFLCAGPGFVLAALHVRLRDTGHLVGVVLLPLFYATPVFYAAGSLDAVPALWLNPMAHVVDGYRAALLHGEWPTPVPLAVVAVAGIAMTAAGRAVYRRAMPRFLEQL